MYQVIDKVTGEMINQYSYPPIETDDHYIFCSVRYYNGDYKVRYAPN